MEIGRFAFHRRALAALDQLPAPDQARILDRLAALAGQPLDHWPPRIVEKLKSDPDLYLIRIDDSLRAIVRSPEGEDAEVLDVVRHETLERFAKVKT